MGIVIDARARFEARELAHLERISLQELEWWLDEACDLIVTPTGIQTGNWSILNPDDD